MMISSFRRSLLNEESGQAIILGAVSLLVLAITIMVTIQLGWTIRERIQLQHAADNAAYTTATIVARSLNFMSWMNRAMIAQYVSAMSFQTLLSHVEALVMIFGFTISMLHNLGAIAGVLGLIPVINLVAKPIAVALGGMGHALKVAVDKIREWVIDPWYGLDNAIAGIVVGISWFNRWVSYFVGQWMLGKGVVNLGLAQSIGIDGFYSQAIEGTAPGANASGETVTTVYNGLAAGLGLLNYADYFDTDGWLELFNGNKPGSEDIPDDKSKEYGSNSENIKNAERLMAELVNASREGKNGVTWETYRGWGPKELFDIIKKIVSGESGEPEKENGFLDGLADILEEVFPNSKGSTMLVKTMDEEVFSEQEGKWSGGNSGKKETYTNHVFLSDSVGGSVDRKAYFSKGEALASVDNVDPFLDVLDKIPLLGDLLDWIGGSIPGVEIRRIVGIQAVGKGSSMQGNRLHCKYKGYRTVAGSIMNLVGNKKVDNPCKQKDENGNPKLDADSDFCKENKGDKVKLSKLLESMAEDNDIDLEDMEGKVDETLYNLFRNLISGVPGNVDYGCDSVEDAKHHKFWGITKYASFNISRYEEKKRYPSFVAAAHKIPKFTDAVGDVGLGFEEDSKFKMSSIGDVQGKKCEDEFEGCLTEYRFNQINDVTIFSIKGMHAWARAQAYYHRPGTWTEPPNMFNPFWRPKLSPMAPYLVGDTLDELGGRFGSEGSQFQEIVQGVLNVASNMVEGVITH